MTDLRWTVMRDDCAGPAWPPGIERAAGIGTWTIDTGSRTTSWSPGQHHVYGVDDGEVRTVDDWLALVHPDDRPLWQRTLQEALDHGAGFAIDHRVVRRTDGTTRWVRCRAS